MSGRWRGFHLVVVVAASALAGAACGTGLPHEEIVKAATQRPVAEAAGTPAGAAVGAPAETAAEATRAGGADVAAGGSGAAAPAAGGTAPLPGSPNRTAGQRAPSPTGGSAAPGTSPGRTVPAASAGSAQGAGTAPGASGQTAGNTPAVATGCGPDCKPIVIGSVGTYSGIVGQNVTPGVKAVQAWAAATNDAGGLNGRRVEVVVADDGSDPARHRALLQELVDNRGVIAFVYNAAPLSGHASIDYVTAKRIPVIGSEVASEWYYSSPMFFPQAASGKMLHAADLAADARAMLPQGIKKVGLIHCSDGIQVCKDAAEVIPSFAKKVGFDFVYQGSGSLAQPDFTAECLAARNAAVQLLIPIMDANSAQRIARSCASVGFKPVYSLGPPILFEHFQEDPNFEGSIGTPVVASWLDTANPAIVQFREAMKRHAPGVPTSASAPLGWVSAKLFERAARNLPAQPTSAAVLEGLWSIQGDTLGGLTFPLRFVRDKVAERPLCAGVVIVKGGKWQVHPNGQLTCAES